jgi:flagellar motor switch protein FliM
MPATLSDTVSQSEIENLLAQVGNEEAATAAPPALAVAKTEKSESVHRHEFPLLSLFSASELRKLRLRHDDFILALAARLSIRFGMEVGIQMSKLETASFKSFSDSLANPTHLTILKLDPLVGHCVLDLPLRLGLCLVERELGGAGLWRDEPRELTKMEANLLSKVIDNILSEWCIVWRDLLDLRPSQVGLESNSRFLDTCAPETVLLVLGIELRFGQIVETMQFGLPYPMLEPLLAKLNASTERAKKISVTKPATPLNWNPMLDEMEMKLTAELPPATLAASQLGELKPGDLIPLTGEMVNQVKLLFEGTPKFLGSLGSQDNSWAVKIDGVLKK